MLVFLMKRKPLFIVCLDKFYTRALVLRYKQHHSKLVARIYKTLLIV